jgi:hypothetical protein
MHQYPPVGHGEAEPAKHLASPALEQSSDVDVLVITDANRDVYVE